MHTVPQSLWESRDRRLVVKANHNANPAGILMCSRDRWRDARKMTHRLELLLAHGEFLFVPIHSRQVHVVLFAVDQ